MAKVHYRQKLASYFYHFRRKGHNVEDLMAMARKRFPGMKDDVLAVALEDTLRAMTTMPSPVEYSVDMRDAIREQLESELDTYCRLHQVKRHD